MAAKAWWQAVQPHSFPASIIPVALGAFIAWALGYPADLPLLGLTVLGVVLIHAATNMSNDYVDYANGVDDQPEELRSPFTGGSRVLPEGKVSKRAHMVVFTTLYFLGALIGVTIALLIPDGWVVLALGFTMGFAAIFYTVPPFKFQYRAAGEVLVAIIFGPVLVFGSFFVQAHVLSWEPVVASVPLGLLISAFLVVNELPELETDRRGGKETIVVKLGRRRAASVYVAMVLSAYAWILAAVLFHQLPLLALLTLGTLVVAVGAMGIVRHHYHTFREHIAANGATILTVILFGLAQIVAYAVAALGFGPRV